jgi:hypothetical protein
MDSDFEVTVGDDPDHEGLVAEITYRNELVCMLTMEQGFDLLKIEIHPRKDCQPWCFDEREFEENLMTAKRRLEQLRKTT